MEPEALFSKKISRFTNSPRQRSNKPRLSFTKEAIHDILRSLQTMGREIYVESRFCFLDSFADIEREGEVLRVVGTGWYKGHHIPCALELVPSEIYFVREAQSGCPAVVLVNSPTYRQRLEDLQSEEAINEVRNNYFRWRGQLWDVSLFEKGICNFPSVIPPDAVYVCELREYLSPVLFYPKESAFEEEGITEGVLEEIICNLGLELLPEHDYRKSR